MAARFNTLLQEAGLALAEVRVLRHMDKRAKKGFSPFELWRDRREQFDLYQRVQKIKDKNKLTAPFWACFAVTPEQETLFIGIYSVQYKGRLEKDTPCPHTDDIDKAGSFDEYLLTLHGALSDCNGHLVIEWGPGYRSWVQYAERHDKLILRAKPEKQ